MTKAEYARLSFDQQKQYLLKTVKDEKWLRLLRYPKISKFTVDACYYASIGEKMNYEHNNYWSNKKR